MLRKLIRTVWKGIVGNMCCTCGLTRSMFWHVCWKRYTYSKVRELLHSKRSFSISLFGKSRTKSLNADWNYLWPWCQCITEFCYSSSFCGGNLLHWCIVACTSFIGESLFQGYAEEVRMHVGTVPLLAFMGTWIKLLFKSYSSV